MDYGMKVFSIKEFRLSARVAIVEHLRESGEFAFYAYNFLQTDATKNYDSSALKLRLVWNPQRPINNLEEVGTHRVLSVRMKLLLPRSPRRRRISGSACLS